MRLLIVGAGATGGFFGARLIQAGRDVTFLLRPARAEQIRRDGLQVLSPQGDFSVTPKVLTADEVKEPFDVVVLTVKAYGLEKALDDIGPAVGENTLVLSTLNGMRHIDVMRERFGASHVGGCVCKIESTIDDAGRIVQFSKINDLIYGELEGGISPRLQALDAILRDAGFNATLSDNIRRDLWEKWVLLASVGVINCLGRGHLGEVIAAHGGLDLVNRLYDEVVATARANEGGVRDDYVQSIRQRITNPASTQTTSMYRDLSAGNPIEADQIVGDLLRRAQLAGVETPLLATAYTQLSVYQNRR